MNWLRKLFGGGARSEDFGGYRTQVEKDAWAQAMVGAEFITEGRYQDAIAISEQALAKSSRCKQAWVVKGGALVLLGKYAEALTCFNKALEIDPQYRDALTQKEIVQKYLGDVASLQR